ncbi:MAG: hypothetical protein UX49_C0037G0013 [Candidatus Wolfebacteria bacterium GW2011_GWC2_46_275]|nr:MAG: hypothetical protein UX49_C0037G0013 [Candidatus Wolfebacteria bacterium GW2011_GWC2_46_275]
MTKEIEQQRRIVELERLNGELAKQVVEAEQRAAGIYEQYQVLRYVIENSPTQHDLLFLKGRIKLLEETLDISGRKRRRRMSAVQKVKQLSQRSGI